MADLNSILQRSKAVMEKTKNLPYGGYVDKSQITVDKDGDVFVESMVKNDEAPMFNESIASKSKLPQEVIEAMRKSSNEPISVIDTTRLSESLITNNKQKKQIKETVYDATTQTPNNASQTIDYSLIKMIVEDSIKKYTTQLKKTIISEEKGNGIQLMAKQGNTFRFVTEDGKIFEGKLTYKGNIND